MHATHVEENILVWGILCPLIPILWPFFLSTGKLTDKSTPLLQKHSRNLHTTTPASATPRQGSEKNATHFHACCSLTPQLSQPPQKAEVEAGGGPACVFSGRAKLDSRTYAPPNKSEGLTHPKMVPRTTRWANMRLKGYGLPLGTHQIG